MTPQFNPKTGGRSIEWTDLTINPVGGCKHACRWEMPDGTVAVCYAETVATKGPARSNYPHGFEYHYYRPHLLDEPRKLKEPNLIFMDSMSDLFGVAVPDEHTRRVLDMARNYPQHTFQALTKAPKRILKFLDAIPANLWVGVSSAPDWFMGKRLTEEQKLRFLHSTIEVLRQVKAKSEARVVWMSIEPLSWNIAPHMEDHGLDWAVIGAATNGPRKYQPVATYVSDVLRVLDRAGTPVFFKGNLEWQPRREDFPVVKGWDQAVRRRQEMAETHGWPLNRMLAADAGESWPASGQGIVQRKLW